MELKDSNGVGAIKEILQKNKIIIVVLLFFAVFAEKMAVLVFGLAAGCYAMAAIKGKENDDKRKQGK